MYNLLALSGGIPGFGSYTRDPGNSSGVNIMAKRSKPKENPSLVTIVITFLPPMRYLLSTAEVVPWLLLPLP